jgi:hypothetical protein
VTEQEQIPTSNETAAPSAIEEKSTKKSKPAGRRPELPRRGQRRRPSQPPKRRSVSPGTSTPRVAEEERRSREDLHDGVA